VERRLVISPGERIQMQALPLHGPRVLERLDLVAAAEDAARP
jgi:hypothetical protein